MTNFSNENPITIRLSLFKIYYKASIIDRISKRKTPFLDRKLTEEKLFETAKNIYLPLFKFIDANELSINLIISGEFLDSGKKNCPELIHLIKKLVQNNKIKIIADAYYGDSLTCLYNSNLWSKRVEMTYSKVKSIFEIFPDSIFLPQLFRNLELERLLLFETRPKFLLRNKGRKIRYETTGLLELRRFDGNLIPWIDQEKDVDLEFFYIPDNLYHEINLLLFQKNIQHSLSVLCMEISLEYNKFLLKKRTKKPTKISPKIRINEKCSLVLYNHLQRSVLRMWDFAAFIIASESNYSYGIPKKTVNSISEKFAGFQDPFYLNYLDTKLYRDSKKYIYVFNSPFEAYVNMQACIKNIEILLKNRI